MGYVIKMGNEKRILSLLFVCILLIASYNYVTTEAQDAADADPTHSGKAFIAEIVPILWLMLIVGSLGVTAFVTWEEIN